MASVSRFRVRRPDETWSDEGPDLLRTKDNALVAMKNIMGIVPRLYVHRKRLENGSMTPWSRPYSRSETLEFFRVWNPGFNSVFHVATEKLAPVTSSAKVVVALVDEGNISGNTQLANSLLKAQFPESVFSGGFVCKETTPGWTSDHAWRDAVDRSPNTAKGLKNDHIFSWGVRMSRSGCWQMAYIIGSLGDRVMTAQSPDWIMHPSDAAISHTWHTHFSIVDHNGANSPFCSNS